MRATPHPRTADATLSCGDVLTFRYGQPDIGERLWCTRHDAYRRVVEVTGVWIWKCPKCGAGRRGGLLRWTAERAAVTHCKRTGHEVGMWVTGDGSTFIVIVPEVDGEEIPF